MRDVLGALAGPRTRALRLGGTKAAAFAGNRARWLTACKDARRRHLAGASLSATGPAPATVRKYAGAGSFPERAVRRPGRSIRDPFLACLAKRFGEACRDAAALWRELQGMGYAFGCRMVQNWLAENRARPIPGLDPKSVYIKTQIYHIVLVWNEWDGLHSSFW